MAVITGINSAAPTEANVHNKSLGSPAAVSATATKAATALTASAQAGVTAGITQPDVPRNVTVKGNASGNAGNVVIHGTDEFGSTLTETIALNGATEVAGTKIFKTVTSVDLPAETHAGTDTVSLGRGSKLGLGRKLSRNTVLNVFLGGAKDSLAGMGFDPTNVYGNYVQLTSALNGTAVLVDFYA